jgi:hypothetical protein
LIKIIGVVNKKLALFWTLWRTRSLYRSIWGKDHLSRILSQIKNIFSYEQDSFMATWCMASCVPKNGLWIIRSNGLKQSSSSLKVIVWPKNQFSKLIPLFLKEAFQQKETSMQNRSFDIQPHTAIYFSLKNWLKKISYCMFNQMASDSSTEPYTFHTLNFEHDLTISKHYFSNQEKNILNHQKTMDDKILKLTAPETLWIKIQNYHLDLIFYMQCEMPSQKDCLIFEQNSIKNNNHSLYKKYKVLLTGSWTFTLNENSNFLLSDAHQNASHLKDHFLHPPCDLNAIFFKGQKIPLFMRHHIPLLDLKIKNKLWAQGQFGQYHGQVAFKLRKSVL